MNSPEGPLSDHTEPAQLSENVASELEIFRKKKHEAWNTPREIVVDVVVEAIGSPVRELERIVGGETNEVYSAATESGQEVIVRLSHHKQDKFGREQWALDHAGHAGAPVPKMFLVKDQAVGAEKVHICVESKILGYGLGHLLGDKRVEDNPELQEALRRFGAALSKVHSVKTNGFGPLDKDGRGLFSSVSDLLRDRYRGRNNVVPLFLDKPVETALLLRAYDILEEQVGNYGDVQPHLTHNDLAPAHVLVEEGEVSGIIDFENAFGADPLLDLAHWDAKFGDKYPLTYVKEGYGDQKLFSGNYEARLHFWKIYRALMRVRYCMEQRKEAALQGALKTIKESVAYFDH